MLLATETRTPRLISTLWVCAIRTSPMSSSRTSVSAIELRVSLEVVCVVSKDSGSESIANIAFVEAID